MTRPQTHPLACEAEGCGAPIERRLGVGRQPKYCPKCRAEIRRAQNRANSQAWRDRQSRDRSDRE